MRNKYAGGLSCFVLFYYLHLWRRKVLLKIIFRPFSNKVGHKHSFHSDRAHTVRQVPFYCLSTVSFYRRLIPDGRQGQMPICINLSHSVCRTHNFVKSCLDRQSSRNYLQVSNFRFSHRVKCAWASFDSDQLFLRRSRLRTFLRNFFRRFFFSDLYAGDAFRSNSRLPNDELLWYITMHCFN